jgi:GT2 family glycosyltransferase
VPSEPGQRPAVSVIVPFRGGREAVEPMLAALARLRISPGDELIVADNTDEGLVVAAVGADRPVLAVRASRERSSYHARNAGARRARGDWLLFLDADCDPDPGLLDAYFAAPIGEDVAALAGQIDGDPGQRSFVARYTRSRKFFRQDAGFLAEAGTAATGNLLIRRVAFEAAAGFAEGIRSGGDVDLCRRLRLAGLRIEPRVGAVVRHHHRESLPSLLGAIARYAAGSRWLNERYPGESPRWPLVPGLLGSGRDIVVRLSQGRVEEAAFRAVDGAGLVAHVIGYRASNDAGRPA